MQTSSNTIDAKETVDYDNLNIITHPRPPRRRQSGVSLIPFRPYVKCLTSVRQSFSFANGYDRWMVTGRDEIFFKQPNARCIGSLIEDCDVSDVIRWDIEPESTRLPMMCKLWIIVDGAVVERGKPHLVQDTAIQIFTSGRCLRGLLATQQHFNPKPMKTTFDRRRRHSWQDINEYHSVPYYQYTRTVQNGISQSIQCNMDEEKLASVQEVPSVIEKEAADEKLIPDLKKEMIQKTVHNSLIPQHRVHISITIQTKAPRNDQSTSMDSRFIEMFNLNLEKNELLLSSVANPYRRVSSTDISSDIISIYRNNKEYKHRGVSTGDDYPPEWLRLKTNFILSNFIKDQNIEKEKITTSPSPRQYQGVQTDLSESKTFSSRSACNRNSSSSITTTNYYEVIDEINDGNSTKQSLISANMNRRNDSDNDTISHLNSNHIEKYSTQLYSNANKQSISSRQSENDYNTLISSKSHLQQQSYSTSYRPRYQLGCYNFSNDATNTHTKSSDSTSTTLLTSLLERYEKTLRERERAVVIVNDELLDVNHVLKYYRQKIKNSSSKQSNAAMTLDRDISLLSAESKQNQPPPTVINLIKDKYRSMPGFTSEEMIKAYMPIPKVYITNYLEASSRKRQTRFDASSTTLSRPDYCDLCLTGHSTNSAWIRYNERRIEELQNRIDLMLKIENNEENQLVLSPSLIPKTTVTQRIDDTLQNRLPHSSTRVSNYYRSPSHQRDPYRLPRQLHQSLPGSLHQLNHYTNRSLTPTRKSVRICTEPFPPYSRTYHRTRSPARSILSTLRSRSVPPILRLNGPVEPSSSLKREHRREIYDTQQSSIPRYCRLYDDVNFRQMYNISRMLDAYLASDRVSRKTYSSLIKSCALDQQIPSPITSIA